jgi:GT2 family glycosyltransferase
MSRKDSEDLVRGAFHKLRAADREGFLQALSEGISGVAADGDSLNVAEALIRSPAAAEAYYHYTHREWDRLLAVAEANRAAPLMASMATAAMLELGDSAGLGDWLEHLPDSLEAVLKYNSALHLAETRIPDPAPRVHALMLVHNRERDVGRAVRAVGCTDYPEMALYVADNGSSDGSYEAAGKALAELEGRIETSLERLPTNIGRPAGHNWLIEKHGHVEADYIAIVDDDLTFLRPDWLARLVAAHRATPDAATAGCKVIDPDLPRAMQGSAMRLQLFEEGRVVYSSQVGALDYGQFDYLDRVDHVIGCLNLYDRRALEDVGLFDLRFSPCQFVDVEHHLRARLKGYEVIYHGLVEAGHKRAMGEESLEGRDRLSNSKGNLVKLTIKHDPEEVRRFMVRERERYRAWIKSILGE